MLTVKHYERIRRAYHVEGKSMRAIERDLGHSYWTIRKALEHSTPPGYRMKRLRGSPVLGPYHAQIDELLASEKDLPRKQRYTSKKIYEIIKSAGYGGAEPTVRGYVSKQRGLLKRPQVYVPLEFEPGADAQVDWGEAWVRMNGEMMPVQMYVMRLCYSRKIFVMAFPTQRQEAFFAAHVTGFAYFGGVPRRMTYDNLTTAVRKILKGSERKEQQGFMALRSHYLFESHFCTPGKGNEKGQVEDGVGYARRNFFVPIPEFESFNDLNEYLRQCCEADDQRRVDRQEQTIAEAWREEQPHLRALPDRAFDACVHREVTLNGYSQVTFDTNRYSVPVERVRKRLRLKAYVFHIEIWDEEAMLAQHGRCYERNQDVLEPLHYLTLLEQRPGAFEHAKPLRQWRQQWPSHYEQLLSTLKQRHAGKPEAVREFIRILQLHQQHSPALMATAIAQALKEGLGHYEGVRFCLNRLLDPSPTVTPLDLSSQPALHPIGQQSLDLKRYDRLLTGGLS